MKDRKVGVLTLKECYDIGRRLDMEEKVVEAALKHFHEHNIFLFFGKIGKNSLVFPDPKALISFVNSIVSFTYMVVNPDKGEDVDEDEGMSLTSYEIQSLQKGIITERLLKEEYFNVNYVPGIYEAGDAIAIFKKLYTIAEGPQMPDLEPEYIMPCLLPRLTSEAFEGRISLLQASQLVQTLHIDFGVGTAPDMELWCSPSGSFGSTIACLISNFNWKICTHTYDQDPECLYHEMATLHPSKLSLEVTLVNMTKYFEVYAYANSENRQKYNKLPVVRTEIVGAVRKVLETMKVKLTVAEGFKCPCKIKEVSHTQYLINPSEGPEFAMCENGHEDHPKSFWIGTQEGM